MDFKLEDCQLKRIINAVVNGSFNPPLGSVHAVFVMASLQCEADEQALASTAYLVAALRSVSEHAGGLKEAAASQDFSPHDIL